jgi:hypothetical protein
MTPCILVEVYGITFLLLLLFLLGSIFDPEDGGSWDTYPEIYFKASKAWQWL